MLKTAQTDYEFRSRQGTKRSIYHQATTFPLDNHLPALKCIFSAVSPLDALVGK